MSSEKTRPPVVILDLDPEMVELLEFEDRLCFHCRPLENPGLPDPGLGACKVRSRDLLPLVRDTRSGIKVATRGGRIVGYAVFGRPELFPYLDGLELPVQESALFIGALYVLPDEIEENTDVDLLIAVMDWARTREYGVVQALCRTGGETEPEARTEMLAAAGFELTEARNGTCLAETTLDAWDRGETDGGARTRELET